MIVNSSKIIQTFVVHFKHVRLFLFKLDKKKKKQNELK